MADVLLVAATDIELCERRGLVCGVGPVEAAAVTARELAARAPAAVVHVGVAGARGIIPGGIVIGSESVYVDLSAEIPVVDSLEPDARLLATTREAVPEALVLPIGTSASVGGSTRAGTRAPRRGDGGVRRAPSVRARRTCPRSRCGPCRTSSPRAIERAGGSDARSRRSRDVLPRVLEAASD